MHLRRRLETIKHTFVDSPRSRPSPPPWSPDYSSVIAAHACVHASACTACSGAAAHTVSRTHLLLRLKHEGLPAHTCAPPAGAHPVQRPSLTSSGVSNMKACPHTPVNPDCSQHENLTLTLVKSSLRGGGGGGGSGFTDCTQHDRVRL